MIDKSRQTTKESSRYRKCMYKKLKKAFSNNDLYNEFEYRKGENM